jgi:hypothetical protein
VIEPQVETSGMPSPETPSPEATEAPETPSAPAEETTD